MKLPRVGDGCVVYWHDTVDSNAWQSVAIASAPQNDHDAIECWGIFLGKTADGYIHIGNQSKFKDGEMNECGLVSDIPLGAVSEIQVIPPPQKNRLKK